MAHVPWDHQMKSMGDKQVHEKRKSNLIYRIQWNKTENHLSHIHVCSFYSGQCLSLMATESYFIFTAITTTDWRHSSELRLLLVWVLTPLTRNPIRDTATGTNIPTWNHDKMEYHTKMWHSKVWRVSGPAVPIWWSLALESDSTSFFWCFDTCTRYVFFVLLLLPIHRYTSWHGRGDGIVFLLQTGL